MLFLVLENADCVLNVLFVRFLAVFVDLCFVLFSVSETTCTADTAANASHTFDEVFFKHALACLHEGDLTSFDTVTYHRVDGEVIDSLLFERFHNGFGKTAATGEDSAIVGCVVEDVLVESRNIKVLAVKERLKLFKGDGAVNIGCIFFSLEFHLLRGARTDEYDLRGGIAFFDILGDRTCGREVVGDIGSKIGECLAYIGNECRAARAGEEALVRKLLRFRKRYHISTESRFNNGVEAELLDACNDLTEFRIRELAGDRGSDNGIDLVLGVLFALQDHVDDVEHIGFIHDGTEGALVYTSAAGDALVVVDLCICLVGMLCDGADLTSTLAGTLEVLDRAVRTYLGTKTAVDTFGFVDVGNMVFIKGDGALLTYVFATVSKSAAANIGHLIAADGTFITRHGNDFDDIGIGAVAAHGELYALCRDGSFLVYAATHGRFLTFGNEDLGNIGHMIQEIFCPRKACNFSEDLIFQMLNFCIKFSHYRYTSFHLFWY